MGGMGYMGGHGLHGGYGLHGISGISPVLWFHAVPSAPSPPWITPPPPPTQPQKGGRLVLFSLVESSKQPSLVEISLTSLESPNP